MSAALTFRAICHAVTLISLRVGTVVTVTEVSMVVTGAGADGGTTIACRGGYIRAEKTWWQSLGNEGDKTHRVKKRGFG